MTRSYVFHVYIDSSDCYVRTTESALNRRKYNDPTYEAKFIAGNATFLGHCNVDTFNGKPILNIRQFDKWLEQHNAM